jgi:rhodanese-related sulfurtransferase
MKKLLIMALLVLSLAGCEKTSPLIKDAENETWTDLNEVSLAINQAEDAFFKDFYFVDIREESAYQATFVSGFRHVLRTEFDDYFNDVEKYAMIVIFSGNSETASEAFGYLDSLGFYNIKVIDATSEALFSHFSNRLMSIDENGETCPIEPQPGC